MNIIAVPRPKINFRPNLSTNINEARSKAVCFPCGSTAATRRGAITPLCTI